MYGLLIAGEFNNDSRIEVPGVVKEALKKVTISTLRCQELKKPRPPIPNDKAIHKCGEVFPVHLDNVPTS
jgi:hypothetical protein